MISLFPVFSDEWRQINDNTNWPISFVMQGSLTAEIRSPRTNQHTLSAKNKSIGYGSRIHRYIYSRYLKYKKCFLFLDFFYLLWTILQYARESPPIHSSKTTS